jgi:hypothetical protein
MDFSSEERSQNQCLYMKNSIRSKTIYITNCNGKGRKKNKPEISIKDKRKGCCRMCLFGVTLGKIEDMFHSGLVIICID